MKEPAPQDREPQASTPSPDRPVYDGVSGWSRAQRDESSETLVRLAEKIRAAEPSWTSEEVATEAKRRFVAEGGDREVKRREPASSLESQQILLKTSNGLGQRGGSGLVNVHMQLNGAAGPKDLSFVFHHARGISLDTATLGPDQVGMRKEVKAQRLDDERLFVQISGDARSLKEGRIVTLRFQVYEDAAPQSPISIDQVSSAGSMKLRIGALGGVMVIEE